MAILHTNFFSDVLQMETSMDVILPVKGQRAPEVHPPYQTLYLLHGLSDNHTAWQRYTTVEIMAQKYNLAVIMPTTHRGFYTDMVMGPRWWTHISQELPAVCEAMFQLSPRREDRFAAGLSMGGYGALKLGLSYPDRFAAVASMSGATLDDGYFAKDPNLDAEMRLVFGDRFREQDSLYRLIEQAAKAAQRPELYLCCGTGDFLFEINVAFREHAKKHGFSPEWSQTEGAGHTWDYWEACLPHVLRWLPLQKAQ